MPEETTKQRPEPKINERFIYNLSFGGKRLGEKKRVIRDLNADGYIDYAHQCGLKEIRSFLLERKLVEDAEGNQTWWATVHVTVTMLDGTSSTGLSCASSRDGRVTMPGYEVAVAETRAIKRAIAVVCNINEEKISPLEDTPTRDTVDMPLDNGAGVDENTMFHGINHEIIRSKKDVMGDTADLDEQFKL